MSFILEPEQFKIIEKAIKDILPLRNGIFSFLNNRGEIIDLEDHIYIPDFSYSRELETGEIGIKILPINQYGINIQNVALIKMILMIDIGNLNRWESMGRQEMTVLNDLKLYNDIKRFIDQIEQFILRGTDTKSEFAVTDINKDDFFNCFFHGHDKRSPTNLYKIKDLNEAVVNLSFDLRKEYFEPPFTLISDSETLKWANYNFLELSMGIKTFKKIIEEKREIDKWINLFGNADNSKGDDFSLVCIAHNKYGKKAIKIIEKSPLNIVPVIGGIILYWCGALETSKNAIQQIRINKINM